MWRLARSTRLLDLNSPYCYLILCKHFTDTCVIAEQDREVVGFVTGYRPPTNIYTVFIWQIGVSEAARGKGLGTAMLLSLLQRNSCRNVSHLEATVTPSNVVSKRMFQSLARQLSTQLSEKRFFGSECFPDSGHEPEDLVRVGPFQPPI